MKSSAMPILILLLQKLNLLFNNVGAQYLAPVFIICLICCACQKKEKVDTNQVVSIMEEGRFEEAIDLLQASTGFFSKDAKACYAMAVALIRKDSPEIKKAIKYKNKAQKLGYQIPEWFDDYVTKLNNDK